MPLKPIVDSLESIDESLHGFYAEKDGKFRLDVDGGFNTHDEVAGLTSALGKEREARSKLQKELKKFEGIEDPEGALKALDTFKKLDQKKLIDAGEVDKVKAEVTKAMQGKIDELQSLVTKKDQILTDELIGGRFSRSKFIGERMTIPTDLVESKFRDRFKIEDGAVVGYNQQGNKIFSRDKPGELADFDEALMIIVEGYPYKDSILKGSAATGPGITPASQSPSSSPAGGGRSVAASDAKAFGLNLEDIARGKVRVVR